MTIGPRQWGIALALSLAAHMAAAGLLETGEPPSEAGSGAQIMLLEVGDAFADAAAAGEPSDTVDPVAEADGVAEPVETGDVAASETEVTGAEESETETADAPDTVEYPVEDTVLAEAEAEEVTPPVETAPAVQAVVTESPEAPVVKPVETAMVPDEMAPTVTDAREVTDVAVASAVAVPVTETLEAMTPVPLPVPRPADAPKPVVRKAEQAPVKAASAQTVSKPREVKTKAAKAPKKTSKKATAKAASQAKTAKSAGAAGEQKQSAQKGGGKSKKASGKDRAAVTNYPGKVAGKLRRSWRFPRSLRGKASRGEVLVSFTVAANGSASGVRVARSSGSSDLDRAAMDAVRRAAPFPPIPSAAGRRSWAFTVPLAVR